MFPTFISGTSISAWCAVAEKVDAIIEAVIFGNGAFVKIKRM